MGNGLGGDPATNHVFWHHNRRAVFSVIRFVQLGAKGARFDRPFDFIAYFAERARNQLRHSVFSNNAVIFSLIRISNTRASPFSVSNSSFNSSNRSLKSKSPA